MNDPIIDVDGLVKTFRGGVRALDGLTLAMPPGAIYGLLGPNGAGKTTLIRILATLLAPDAGTARVAGIDVRTDPAAVRTRIGLAGQYAAVDDYLTGRENVELVGQLYGLPPRERRRRAADILDRMRLETVADRQVKTYSGGMRRRLDLAASLTGRPAVLFLDEPTTGLDPASRRDLWELIRGLVDDGATVLLTTQYLDEADRLADRIAVIDAGRVITEGTPDQLKNTVGAAVVELTVAEPDRTRTLDVLHPLCARAADSHRGSLAVPATAGPATLRRVLRALHTAGIDPDDIALRKPTLDDVFASLTGRTRAGTTPSDAPTRSRRSPGKAA
jgi:ABC-2 type transport system ATP-binding protein